MHYKIDGLVIKSENAAKSYKQKSKALSKRILAMGPKESVLDYGCGKLRYLQELEEIGSKVFLTDSHEQLNRIQSIWDFETSVKQYVKDRGKVSIIDLENLSNFYGEMDFVLCSNVLSAVPRSSVRLEILNNIKILLSDKGSALITTQYRNSYFKNYRDREDAHEIDEGFAYKKNGNSYYYGILNPNIMEAMFKEAKLTIISKKLHDGSAYFSVSK